MLPELPRGNHVGDDVVRDRLYRQRPNGRLGTWSLLVYWRLEEHLKSEKSSYERGVSKIKKARRCAVMLHQSKPVYVLAASGLLQIVPSWERPLELTQKSAFNLGKLGRLDAPAFRRAFKRRLKLVVSEQAPEVPAALKRGNHLAECIPGSQERLLND